jgi:hypothetical protein
MLLQPGDQAEIIEIVMSAKLCLALLDQVVETDYAAFGSPTGW